MTDCEDGDLRGFPDDVRELICAPPVADKRLLELAVTWNRASPAVARMAEATRVFLLTWDPLEWLGPRPDAVATLNAAPPGLELVVYAPLWSVLKRAATDASTDARTAAAVLGAMAGSAVAVAAANEDAVRTGRYPLLVEAGAVPTLLSEPAGGREDRGDPVWRLVSQGWEPIGLGAITDIVQDAFGRVELDRCPVELAPIPAPHRSCPGCQGGRFGFPGELTEAVSLMCPGHQRQAGAVTQARLEAAQTSNPDRWGALGEACERLERPHAPNGLASKLAGAEQAMFEVPEPARLRARAQALIEAAGWFPGRAEDLAVALGAAPDMSWLPDWVMNMVLDLGRAGLGEQAAALASVDSDHQALYQADVGVALAEAGQHEQARARVAANLDAWPDDFWVRVHAGDALAALGHRPAATAQFVAALGLAEGANDFEARADAMDRLATVEGASTRPDHRRKAAISSSAARPGATVPAHAQAAANTNTVTANASHHRRAAIDEVASPSASDLVRWPLCPRYESRSRPAAMTDEDMAAEPAVIEAPRRGQCHRCHWPDRCRRVPRLNSTPERPLSAVPSDRSGEFLGPSTAMNRNCPAPSPARELDANRAARSGLGPPPHLWPHAAAAELADLLTSALTVSAIAGKYQQPPQPIGPTGLSSRERPHPHRTPEQPAPHHRHTRPEPTAHSSRSNSATQHQRLSMRNTRSPRRRRSCGCRAERLCPALFATGASLGTHAG